MREEGAALLIYTWSETSIWLVLLSQLLIATNGFLLKKKNKDYYFSKRSFFGLLLRLAMKRVAFPLPLVLAQSHRNRIGERQQVCGVPVVKFFENVAR